MEYRLNRSIEAIRVVNRLSKEGVTFSLPLPIPGVLLEDRRGTWSQHIVLPTDKTSSCFWGASKWTVDWRDYDNLAAPYGLSLSGSLRASGKRSCFANVCTNIDLKVRSVA